MSSETKQHQAKATERNKRCLETDSKLPILPFSTPCFGHCASPLSTSLFFTGKDPTDAEKISVKDQSAQNTDMVVT